VWIISCFFGKLEETAIAFEEDVPLVEVKAYNSLESKKDSIHILFFFLFQTKQMASITPIERIKLFNQKATKIKKSLF